MCSPQPEELIPNPGEVLKFYSKMAGKRKLTALEEAEYELATLIVEDWRKEMSDNSYYTSGRKYIARSAIRNAAAHLLELRRGQP